jgi:hypothetical protein
MLVKLLASVQSYISQYPSTLEYAGKAINWLGRQPFTPELSTLWNRISFNVNFGDAPDIGVQRFTVTKQSGTNKVFGSSANQSNFELTFNGLVQSAKSKVTAKKSDAAQKATVAKERAAEAQRLAAEAQRLAELAESEANSLESVNSTFGRIAQYA